MITVLTGSVCDICLEPFGIGFRSPCTILCGHVYCMECINKVRTANQSESRTEPSYGSCPMCRAAFDHRTMIKLHVDFSTSNSNLSRCPSTAETEAKRLQDAIAKVADEGTTETALRKLIAESATFLSTQHHDKFPELRICHRVIAYMCDVKSKFRDQKADYEKQIGKLKEEKADIERKAEVAAAARKDERESSLVIEKSLREHCEHAQQAYKDMVGHYNFVVAEWTKLTTLSNQFSQQHAAEASFAEGEDPATLTASEIVPHFNANLASYHDQCMIPSGAAITDSTSFLVSPLPQFTGQFASSSLRAFPLPDIESDVETKFEPASRMPSSLTSVSRASESSLALHPKNRTRPSRSRSGTVSAPAEDLNRPPLIPVSDHNSGNDFISADSSSTPKARQSTSHTFELTVRNRSSSDVPHPSSPLHIVGSSTKTHNRSMSSTIEPSPTFNASVASSAQPHSFKNNRLHDLLQDSTPVGMTSSLPNMPAQSPSSSRRESFNSREKERPSLLSSSYHPPMLQYPHHRETTEVPSSDSVPPRPILPSYDPTKVASSSASSAAKALEKAKRDRERTEMAERDKEKDRERRDKVPTRENGDYYTESYRKGLHEGSTLASSSASTSLSSASASASMAAKWTDSAETSDRSRHGTFSRHASLRDPGSSATTSSYTYGSQWMASNHQSSGSSPFIADKYGLRTAAVTPPARA